MREIQVTKAKTRLAELLRVVEHGETVAITRHGKPVAHLVPAPALATAIVPPCPSTMAWAMAKPRPVPPIPRLRDWSVRYFEGLAAG